MKDSERPRERRRGRVKDATVPIIKAEAAMEKPKSCGKVEARPNPNAQSSRNGSFGCLI